MNPRLRGLLLAVLLCSPAAAQPPAPDTLPRHRLDTLAVAALRLPAVPLRAPFSLSSVSGPELDRARPAQALDQVLLTVPGVQVDNRFNPSLGERISVRGFGARAQFGVRGVKVLVDGVPATFPDGQTALNHVDAASVARVEVVRGPAAALYGNASGGVIRLETTAPPAGPLALGASVSAGADGARRTRAALGGETGRVWYRAELTRLATDGYRRHASAESWLARGGAGVRLGGHRLGVSWSWVDYEARNPGSLSDSLLRLDRRQAFARNVAQGTGESGRQRQGGVRWEHAGAVDVEVAAYGTLRDIDNPIPAAVVVLDRSVAGVRGTLADARDAGPLRLRWSLGAELERQDDDRRNFANQAGERGGLTLDQRERVRNRAGFAQAALALPGRAELLAAVRHDRFAFRASDRMPVTPTDPDDSGTRRFGAWSPTAGVSVALGRGIWAYANHATAFETPTTTELANRPDSAGGFNPGLRPQRTRAWEGGVKLGTAVAFVELAAYTARVRDQLVPFEVASAPGRVFFRNAGLSRHRGVEAAASLAPWTGVRVRGAYTHTDARLRVYRVGGVDVAGNRVPGVSPHRFSGSLWLGAERGAFAGVEVRTSSSTPVSDIDADGRLRSPGYTLLDLRAGWSAARAAGLRLTPWAALTNALGARYNASVVVNAFGGRFYEPGPGRALSLGIDLSAPSSRGDSR